MDAGKWTHIGPSELWNQRIEAVRQGGMAAITDAMLERERRVTLG